MPATTYLPTDLQRRYRLVLDQAKAGEARVRDLDGTNVLLLPEAEVEVLRRVNAAAANLAAVERVLDRLEDGEGLERGPGASARPDLLQYGDWTWLRVFDPRDLRAFVRDVREAVIVAVRERSTALLDEELRAWRVTAEQAEDPLLRAVLEAGPSEDDFIEVPRPRSPGRSQSRAPRAPSAPHAKHVTGAPRAGE
jgi:hypothetical protein